MDFDSALAFDAAADDNQVAEHVKNARVARYESTFNMARHDALVDIDVVA